MTRKVTLALAAAAAVVFPQSHAAEPPTVPERLFVAEYVALGIDLGGGGGVEPGAGGGVQPSYAGAFSSRDDMLAVYDTGGSPSTPLWRMLASNGPTGEIPLFEAFRADVERAGGRRKRP